MEAMNKMLSVPVSLMSGLALAADSDALGNRYGFSYVALTGERDGFATDGKRMHCTADVLEDHARIVSRVDVRAFGALRTLRADSMRPLDSLTLDIETVTLTHGVAAITFPRLKDERDEMPISCVRDVARMALKNKHDSAIVRTFKATKYGTTRKTLSQLATAGATVRLSVSHALSDCSDAGTLEMEPKPEAPDFTTDKERKEWCVVNVPRGIYVNATYMRDAAAWVGDGCSISITTADDAGAVVLKSRDGDRFAFVMPINVR